VQVFKNFPTQSPPVYLAFLFVGSVWFVPITLSPKLTFVLGRFLGKNMAFERLATFHRSAGADDEALGGALFRLHFRHDKTNFFKRSAKIVSAVGFTKENSKNNRLRVIE